MGSYWCYPWDILLKAPIAHWFTGLVQHPFFFVVVVVFWLSPGVSPLALVSSIVSQPLCARSSLACYISSLWVTMIFPNFSGLGHLLKVPLIAGAHGVRIFWSAHGDQILELLFMVTWSIKMYLMSYPCVQEGWLTLRCWTLRSSPTVVPGCGMDICILTISLCPSECKYGLMSIKKTGPVSCERNPSYSLYCGSQDRNILYYKFLCLARDRCDVKKEFRLFMRRSFALKVLLCVFKKKCAWEETISARHWPPHVVLLCFYTVITNWLM